jgi:hypothetical protein
MKVMMKLKHALEIKEAIAKWVGSQVGLKNETETVVCGATFFNWEVFHRAKVRGNSITFLASELYPYLTSAQITKALMKITGIDGRGANYGGI